jgi:hypothetical protein
LTRVLVRALPIALLTSACYAYTPIPTTAIAPDMTVRAEIAGAEGRTAERVEGKVFEVGPGSLSMLPEARPGADGSPRTLSFSELASVSERRLDSTRTMLIVGAGMAAGVGALLLVKGNPADDPGGPGGPGDFSVLPVLRGLISLFR